MLLKGSTDATARSAGDARPGPDVARLRLICLVRVGDGYLVRAVGHGPGPGPTRPVDLGFGDAADRGRAGELEVAVRHVQRWCDDGTTVDLVDAGGRLALRAPDGTEVVLPHGG